MTENSNYKNHKNFKIICVTFFFNNILIIVLSLMKIAFTVLILFLQNNELPRAYAKIYTLLTSKCL